MDPTEEVGEPIANQIFPQEAAAKSTITGWLFMLAIGVFTNPLIIGYNLFILSSSMALYRVAFPGSIVPTLLFFIYPLLLILTTLGLYLFLKRKKSFRKFYIWTLLISAVLYNGFSNSVWIEVNKAVEAGRITKAVGDTIKAGVGPITGKAILVAIIWVPYLIRSKRVKLTFNQLGK